MRRLIVIVSLFFVQTVFANDYLCTITRSDNSTVAGIPMILGPQTSALFLFGQNIFQYRIYYYNDYVDLMEKAAERANWRPDHYNDSKFVAVSRFGKENALSMYIGSIKNSKEITAGLKYRHFDEKGPQQDVFTTDDLSVHCESR